MESLISCMTKTGEDTIAEAEKLLEDFPLLRKVACVDFVAKEVKYNNSCRLSCNTYLKLGNARAWERPYGAWLFFSVIQKMKFSLDRDYFFGLSHYG